MADSCKGKCSVRLAFSFLLFLATCVLSNAQGVLFRARGQEPLSKISVTTHLYDNARSGWNQAETVLTASTVASIQFGLLASKTDLGAMVGAQPVLVPNLTVAGGTHDVLYVVTYDNFVRALDARTLVELVSVQLGTPVPTAAIAGGACVGNPNLGIASTPVIDTATQTLYVMAYEYPSSVNTWRLHALSLTTLADKVAPATVAAAATLTDSTTFNFAAANQMQRPALLLANSNIYAGFGSWCDLQQGLTRGWLLAWDKTTLTPIASANSKLINRVKPDPVNMPYYGGVFPWYMTSIWMSGAGPAADDAGNIYVVTSNSDSGQDVTSAPSSYNETANLSESVIKFSPGISSVLDYFSPGAAGGAYMSPGVEYLDTVDGDFGAGGVTVLTDLPGTYPHVALAAGKQGILYMLNRDNMGHHHNPDTGVINTYTIDGCWCALNYFTGSDGTLRVVTNGGLTQKIWKVQTSPSTGLSLEYTLPAFGNGGFDPGFFASVSSNGTQAGSHVLWTVSRPETALGNGRLRAVDPSNGTVIFSQPLPATGVFYGSGNTNLVPLVANGKVYVAPYDGGLYVYGLH